MTKWKRKLVKNTRSLNFHFSPSTSSETPRHQGPRVVPGLLLRRHHPPGLRLRGQAPPRDSVVPPQRGDRAKQELHFRGTGETFLTRTPYKTMHMWDIFDSNLEKKLADGAHRQGCQPRRRRRVHLHCRESCWGRQGVGQGPSPL